MSRGSYRLSGTTRLDLSLAKPGPILSPVPPVPLMSPRPAAKKSKGRAKLSWRVSDRTGDPTPFSSVHPPTPRRTVCVRRCACPIIARAVAGQRGAGTHQSDLRLDFSLCSPGPAAAEPGPRQKYVTLIFLLTNILLRTVAFTAI